AVDVRARRVAHHEAVAEELALDGLDRPAHAPIGRGEKTDERDHEQARVEVRRAERLRERVPLRVVALVADLAVDRVAERSPLVDRTLEAEARRGLDRAIEADPR